jgi:hypothetical protein
MVPAKRPGIVDRLHAERPYREYGRLQTKWLAAATEVSAARPKS